MSMKRSCETSCLISSIGKSGASAAGPIGSCVPGWSGGGGAFGRSAAMLYQRSGICDSLSKKRVCVAMARPPVDGVLTATRGGETKNSRPVQGRESVAVPPWLPAARGGHLGAVTARPTGRCRGRGIGAQPAGDYFPRCARFGPGLPGPFGLLRHRRLSPAPALLWARWQTYSSRSSPVFECVEHSHRRARVSSLAVRVVNGSRRLTLGARRALVRRDTSREREWATHAR